MNKIECYLCKGTSVTKVHNKVRFEERFKPYQCNDCELVFLHPYYNAEELKEYYTNQYLACFGESTSQEIFERCLPEAKIRAERYRKILNDSENILEIGCSAGHFLHVAQKIVPNVYGVELGEAEKQHATNLGIRVREEIQEFQSRKFDAIFMFHVLEHITDPIFFLKEIEQYLKKDGKLIIEVPNIDDILVSVYKIKKFMDIYFSAQHKFYFSNKTLGRMLSRAGFKCDIFPLQRYDLSNHVYWMLHGKPGGAGYFNDIFRDELDKGYQDCLAEKFLCDTIHAIAERI